MAERKHPDYYYRQSAVVPFRFRWNGPEILLITSRKKKRWIVPKGVVEPDLSPQDSALMEAFEEAGLRGRVVGPALGRYTYEKWGGVCTVEVFPMRVTETLAQWPEREVRTRRWLPPLSAARRADDAKVAAMIRKLAARLGAAGKKKTRDAA
ncbi:MAG: NUDIX hydrolase [Rhodospirillales bacterium]|jgi:phosphohistidine phosphatase|nr:NUDIX hydrolase [Rhodospirillales bacterium]